MDLSRISARQSISSRYLGPTNHRGARIVATSASGHRKVVSWDYDLDVAQNHAVALRAMAESLGWSGTWTLASTKDGYAAALLGSDTTFVVASESS